MQNIFVLPLYARLVKHNSCSQAARLTAQGIHLGEQRGHHTRRAATSAGGLAAAEPATTGGRQCIQLIDEDDLCSKGGRVCS